MNLRKDLREFRQRESVERKTERATRTPAEQIAVLDRRLGVAKGAVKERTKLAALINLMNLAKKK